MTIFSVAVSEGSLFGKRVWRWDRIQKSFSSRHPRPWDITPIWASLIIRRRGFCTPQIAWKMNHRPADVRCKRNQSGSRQWRVGDLPEPHLGFVHFPVFGGIAIAMLAPVGAAVAHRLPTQRLRQILAVVLYLFATRMLISIW